jgi:glucan phosphoethanolaminetransferase (alkaline phosphatase superfamily)
MNDILTYLFWPNPGNADYGSPKAIALLALCALMVLGSFALSWWRRNKASPAIRKVSRSWASAMRWFGIIGLLLVISRAEEIQYLSMRFLWAVWLGALLFYLFWQVRMYRNRYYEILPNEPVVDPRSKYLPKRKRR